MIDDSGEYPDSYVRLHARYWDFYHQRKGNTVHDYDQSEVRFAAMTRRRQLIAGFEAGHTLLHLKQQQVFTDTDKLWGKRYVPEGKFHLGYTGSGERVLSGLRHLHVVASAGWGRGFHGGIEGLLRWQHVSLQVGTHTQGNRLELLEELRGFRFPFHFPFRTERVWGRLELKPRPALWLHTWVGIETSHGDGDYIKGFQNRLWNKHISAGAALGHRVAPRHHLHPVAVLSRDVSGPPGFCATIEHHRTNGDLAMFFQGDRYALLDDMDSHNTSFRLDLVPHKWLAVFGGWERLRFRHEVLDRSFLSPWPFSVWEAFLLDFYRLGNVDFRLDTWFAGAGTRLSHSFIDFEFSARFEWWNSDGALDWFERESPVPPFIFTFNRHPESVAIDPRYAVQVDPAVWLRVTSRDTIRMSGQLIAPFTTKKVDTVPRPPSGGAPAPASGGEDRTHGGLMGSVELIRRF